MLQSAMQKQNLITSPTFGRRRLTSKPLPDKPIRVAFLHPTPLQRAGMAFGKAGFTILRFTRVAVPITLSVAVVGHDFLAAAAYNVAGCNIKGNVSYSGGQKIFHVPGQSYYSETTIRLFRGERWFCSEAEARAAGWRKARA